MIHRIIHRIIYFFIAKGKHSIHADFLFQLYTKHIILPSNQNLFVEIEKKRKNLLANNTEITYQDLGAVAHKNKTVTVAKIAKKSLSRARYSQLQYRLILHFKPKKILEIGTSLGINALYFAKAAPQSNIVSLEGIAQICAIANQNVQHLAPNIAIVEGNFDATLEQTLKKMQQIDYAFLDGNHTYEATLKYFKLIVPYLHENSVLVIDDLYWSSQMTKAWIEIITHSEVIISINLHKMGILFFSKKQSKQDFILKY